MKTLAVNDVVISYGFAPVVKHISLQIPVGKISVLIGANACGKSTLLKTMARLMKPQQGSITLDGKPVESIPTKTLAQSIGLLPQTPVVPEGIRVIDLIGRGRFPHRSFFQGWTQKDTDAVSEAIDAMGIADIADRCVDELSGGQRQRVWIAMSLAQQTDILLLDEPTTYLDIAHQIEILDMLTELNRRKGTTIIMVLHEINLAARYADCLFAMRDGELVAKGAPAEIINTGLMKTVFGLNSVILSDPISQAPMICPRSRCGK